jgi:thiamine biosynthesis lipoprotein
MGTVFSIDIRDEGSWTAAIDAVVSWLHSVDAIFSTYRPDSDISRIARGELLIADAAPDVAVVLDLCRQLEAETDGHFSARYDDRLDPTGLVKGWAIEAASRLLRGYGSSNHSVNGGGDIQLAGEAAPGRPWRVGISDPADRTRLLTVVTGRNLAVATSGTAERGQHIVDPHTGAAASSLASVTVVGRHLTRADAYATAAIAKGADALAWLERLPGHEALVVDSAGVHETRGFADVDKG